MNSPASKGTGHHAAKPDPVETERRFQRLLTTLSFPASARQRLFSIAAFLDTSDHDAGWFQTYATEILQYIPEFVLKAEFSGTDPLLLHTLHGKLACISEALQSDILPDGFSEALLQLQLDAARQYVYVGELEKALALLGGFEASAWYASLQANEQLPLPGQLRYTLAQAEKSAPSIHLLLAELIQSIENSRRGDESVLVPVVERRIFDPDQSEAIGGLRRVSLNVLGSASEQRDQVHTDAAVYGVDEHSSYSVDLAAAAARKFAQQARPGLSGPFINAQVVIEGKHELHEGSSAGLAIAALVYSAILRFAYERVRLHMRPTAALTGVLDADGKVLAVDPEGIAAKVAAVFFSKTECLVVPKQQLQLAEEAVEMLQMKYPRRNPALIGVSHLREVFYDRRTAETVRISWPRHAVHRVWKRRRPITAVVLLALVVAVFRLGYGPLDKNPVGCEFSGEVVLIKNKSDQTIEEMHVGERTVNFFKSVLPGGPPIAFADVDGDGQNEIFLSQFSHEGLSSATTINARKIGKDSSIWSFSTSKTLDFPRSTDVSSPEFIAQRLIVDDCDNDGRLEVVVSAAHLAFPNLVYRLDASTGKELGHYLHLGHLAGMRVWDLDGDGIKEILLCGVNNAFKNACLVVLDPRDMNGVSPTTGDYIPTEYPPAKERAYVRIPRTVLGTLYERVAKYNLGRWIAVEPEKQSIRLLVTDVYSVTGPPNEQVSADFDLIMDFKFTPIGITSGDNFDALYDYHLKEKQLPDLGRNEYLQQFMKTLLYWDGEGWQARAATTP